MYRRSSSLECHQPKSDNHGVDYSVFNEIMNHFQILERKGQDQFPTILVLRSHFLSFFFLDNFLCLRLNLGSTLARLGVRTS